MVLPGARILLNCAPGSTSTAGLCSRGHTNCLFVLLGAQILLECSPGSTNTVGLCSREHKYCLIVLPGAQGRRNEYGAQVFVSVPHVQVVVLADPRQSSEISSCPKSKTEAGHTNPRQSPLSRIRLWLALDRRQLTKSSSPGAAPTNFGGKRTSANG